eukprot:708768-Rhodomonas_salina.2
MRAVLRERVAYAMCGNEEACGATMADATRSADIASDAAGASTVRPLSPAPRWCPPSKICGTDRGLSDAVVRV